MEMRTPGSLYGYPTSAANGEVAGHVITYLGIDSLDVLDIPFAIDRRFGIEMPLEPWTQDVNEGKAAIAFPVEALAHG